MSDHSKAGNESKQELGASQQSSTISRRELLGGLSAIGVASALGMTSISSSKEALAAVAHPANPYPVNLFQGTGGHGHLYPGASMPFGMVQLSPDTYNDDWDWCSGYHASDTSIMGFSHTHLSGTGCGDLLDFLVMPRTGEVKLEPGDRKNPEAGYRSKFDKKTESGEPGYYSVLLAESKIKAELTATEHAGFHRYTFPASDSAHFIVDLAHIYGPIDKNLNWATLQVQGNDTLLVAHSTNSWGANREIFGALQFSKPFDKLEVFVDGKPAIESNTELRGKVVKAVVHYKTHAGEQILVKTGISGTGVEGAQKNLQAEIPAWDFAKVKGRCLGSVADTALQDSDRNAQPQPAHPLLLLALSLDAWPHALRRCRRPVSRHGRQEPQARSRPAQLHNLLAVGYLPRRASTLHAHPRRPRS